jgi:hypothetical protein
MKNSGVVEVAIDKTVCPNLAINMMGKQNSLSMLLHNFGYHATTQ